MEEQRPGHNAGRDAQRPTDGGCPGAADAAADRSRRRDLLLGHGGSWPWGLAAFRARRWEQVVQEVEVDEKGEVVTVPWRQGVG